MNIGSCENCGANDWGQDRDHGYYYCKACGTPIAFDEDDPDYDELRVTPEEQETLSDYEISQIHQGRRGINLSRINRLFEGD